jgi:hypothetical protein
MGNNPAAAHRFRLERDVVPITDHQSACKNRAEYFFGIAQA